LNELKGRLIDLLPKVNKKKYKTTKGLTNYIKTQNAKTDPSKKTCKKAPTLNNLTNPIFLISK
jgi:hypothetical protein